MNEQFIKELIQRLKNRVADLVGAVTELELMVEIRSAEVEELKSKLAKYEDATVEPDVAE